MRLIKLTLSGVLLSILMTGCGFALRGEAIPLPARYTKTYLNEAVDVDSEGVLSTRLKALIHAGGGEVVAREVADVFVQLSPVTQSGRQLAISSDRFVKEYEYTYCATITVIDSKSEVQLGSRELSTTQMLQLDERSALSNEKLKRVARESAEKNLATQAVRYMKTL